jgi:hypothetical protein
MLTLPTEFLSVIGVFVPVFSKPVWRPVKWVQRSDIATLLLRRLVRRRRLRQGGHRGETIEQPGSDLRYPLLKFVGIPQERTHMTHVQSLSSQN